MTNGSTELFVVLETVLQRIEDRPLTWDSDLHALGLDSIATVEAVLQIEERYNISLPDELLVPQTFATPTTLWAAIRSAANIAESANQ